MALHVKVASDDGQYFPVVDASDGVMFTIDKPIFIGQSNTSNYVRISSEDTTIANTLNCPAGLRIQQTDGTAVMGSCVLSAPDNDAWSWFKVASSSIGGTSAAEVVNLSLNGNYTTAKSAEFDITLKCVFDTGTFESLETVVHRVAPADLLENDLNFAVALDSANKIFVYAILNSQDGADMTLNANMSNHPHKVALHCTFTSGTLGFDGTITSSVDPAIAAGATFVRYSSDGLFKRFQTSHKDLVITNTGNVGIGLATDIEAAEKLHVDGTVLATSHLLAPSGNLGVGTAAPVARMHLRDGNLLIDSSASPITEDIGSELMISTSKNTATLSSTQSDFPVLIAANHAISSSTGIAFTSSSNASADHTPGASVTFTRTGGTVGDFSGDLKFNVANSGSATGPLTNAVIVKSDGKVGIGLSNPDAQLHVAGDLMVDGTIVGDLEAGTVSSGNVLVDSNLGIGTAAPVTRMHLRDGNFLIDSTASPITEDIGNELMILTSKNTSNLSSTLSDFPMLIVANHDVPSSTGIAFTSSSNASADHTPGASVTFTRTGGTAEDFSGDLKINVANSGTLTGALTNAVIVKSDGKVGIGLSNPAAELHVAGDLMVDGTIVGNLDLGNMSGTLSVARGGTGATSSTGTGSVVLNNNPYLYGGTFAHSVWINSSDGKQRLHFGNNTHTYIKGAHDIRFRCGNGGTEHLTLWSGGGASFNTGSGTFYIQNINGNSIRLAFNTTVGTIFKSGADRMRFENNGNVVVNGHTHNVSDDRIKTGEQLIENGMATLRKLRPQTYTKWSRLDFRESDEATSVYESGFIAQEMFYDAPELRHLVHVPESADSNFLYDPVNAVPTSANPQVDPDYSMWGDEIAGVDYNGLMAYVVKALQEKDAEIQELDTELTDTRASLLDLKARLDAAGI